MKEINYEMLQEDLTFPLQSDVSRVYIWDAKYQMVANFLHYGSVNFVKEKVLGEMKTFTESKETCIINDRGLIVSKGMGFPMLMVRGWGNLKYKDNPEQRQENILNYLLNCLNS